MSQRYTRYLQIELNTVASKMAYLGTIISQRRYDTISHAHFAAKQNNSPNAMRHHAFNREGEHKQVEEPEDQEERVRAYMEGKRGAGMRYLVHLGEATSVEDLQEKGVSTNPFYTISDNPMERFEEKKNTKHRGKRNVEFVTEDSEGE
jgi:hypothetical protein